MTLPRTAENPAVDRPNRPAAVLWDMDGTLVDTEPYWFAAERDLVEQHGSGHWPDELAHEMIGSDLLDGAAFLQRHGGVDLPAIEIVEQLLDGVIARLHRAIPWRPGALELLDQLRAAEIPCALVTMSWRRFVDPILAALPTDTFVATITGDEVPEGQGKPAPTPYLLGAEACGADPADCVAIEDSPTGVRSALAAGCRVLGVHNIRPLAPTAGLTIIESLEGVDVAVVSDLLAPDHPDLMPPADHPRLRLRDRLARSGSDTIRVDRRAIAALLALTLAAAAFLLLTRDDDPPPLPPGAVAIDVWAPYWTLGDAVATADDRLPMFREISPFWFGARGATEIVVDEQAPSGSAAEFLDAVGDVPGDLVPSIRDEMPAGGMASVLADPESRRAHIETIVEFADELDVDGIDLDYEQFAFADGRSSWTATRPNWVTFVEELAAELHDDDRSLTISIPGVWGVVEDDGEIVASEGYSVYDHGAIAEFVDAIRIMAYDYSVSAAGPIAPVAWVQDVVDGTSTVVPEEYHDKLVLGVPSYGSNWVTSALGECPESADGRTNVTTRSVADLVERRGGLPTYDPVTAEWSFSYALTVASSETSCIQNREVHWVDAEGIEARVEIARRAGWGGVALWALGYEDDEAWDALVSGSRRALAP